MRARSARKMATGQPSVRVPDSRSIVARQRDALQGGDRVRLIDVQREIRRPDVEDDASCPGSGQAGYVGAPAGHRQAMRWREPVQDPGDHVTTRPARDHVDVIDHQQCRLRRVAHRLHQSGDAGQVASQRTGCGWPSSPTAGSMSQAEARRPGPTAGWSGHRASDPGGRTPPVGFVRPTGPGASTCHSPPGRRWQPAAPCWQRAAPGGLLAAPADRAVALLRPRTCRPQVEAIGRSASPRTDPPNSPGTFEARIAWPGPRVSARASAQLIGEVLPNVHVEGLQAFVHVIAESKREPWGRGHRVRRPDDRSDA